LGGFGRLDSHGQALRKGPGPSGRLGQPLCSLSQLTPKGLSPAHGFGSLAPKLVPLADDLAEFQLSLPHFRPCQRRLAHAATASNFSSSQNSRRSATSALRWARRALALTSAALWDHSEAQTPLSRRMNSDLAVLTSASS
jgi:hypothetical protein